MSTTELIQAIEDALKNFWENIRKEQEEIRAQMQNQKAGGS